MRKLILTGEKIRKTLFRLAIGGRDGAQLQIGQRHLPAGRVKDQQESGRGFSLYTDSAGSLLKLDWAGPAGSLRACLVEKRAQGAC